MHIHDLDQSDSKLTERSDANEYLKECHKGSVSLK